MTSVMGMEQRAGEVIKSVNDDESNFPATDIDSIDEMAIRQIEAMEAEAQDSSIYKGIGVEEIDDAFLEHVEAIEAEVMNGRKVGEGHEKKIESWEEDESEDDDESSEGSYWGSESEEEDIVNNKINDIADEDEGDLDDDIVDLQPSKKMKGKDVIDQSTEPVERAVQLEDVSVELKKGISLNDVYGYEDLEPMYGDSDMNLKAAHVDLSKEDDRMYVGRTFGSREEFRVALSIYAINRVFRFRFTRYEKNT